MHAPELVGLRGRGLLVDGDHRVRAERVDAPEAVDRLLDDALAVVERGDVGLHAVRVRRLELGDGRVERRRRRATATTTDAPRAAASAGDRAAETGASRR